MPRTIPLARPNITQAEIDAVTAVLRTPCLSIGPVLTAFEDAFATYTGTQHAVGCSSGTAALHMVLLGKGVGEGDEVITTPFSFVASANAVLMVGATPVFVDIDPNTWNIDPARIEAAITPKTRAVLAVDVFGQIADMDAIRTITEKHGLALIEDSCEALASTSDSRPAGSLGDAGVFGFYPNKQITTGEGGMIVTNDAELAKSCRSLRNQGRADGAGWLAHDQLGYNYRLSEINAALGIVQLQRIDELVASRNAALSMYRERLGDETRIQWQRLGPGMEMSWFVFVVRLVDEYDRADRDRILERLRAEGIGCSNYFAPIHLQPFYREQRGHKRGEHPICEALGDRTIALPFHHELTEADADFVCKKLQDLL